MQNSRYSPIDNMEESKTSSEDGEPLLRDGYETRNPRREPRSTWTMLMVMAGFIFYSIALVFATTNVVELRRSRPLTNSAIRNPYQDDVSKYISYQTHEFPEKESFREGGYFTEPSEELDEKWGRLVQNMNMEISPATIERLGRTNETIQLPNGNYMGTFMVFHHLHCLKHIYRALHPDYYDFENLDAEERRYQDNHVGHCLHLLQEAIMCQGDTTLVTMQWDRSTPFLIGNYSTPHQCVNWDRLMEWAEPHSFDAFAPGVLVHPTLGPTIVNGTISGSDRHHH